MRHDRPGFTLIELLMVLAVIVLLAALAFPVTGLVRKQADSLKCRSHLRQIGMAFQIYAQNNSGQLAGIYLRNDHFWHGLLAPYLEALTHNASGTIAHGEVSRNSILWGCPCYDWGTTTSGWCSGYARNYYPLFNPAKPSVLIHDDRVATSTSASFRVISMNSITFPTKRLLVMDGGNYCFNFLGSLAAVRASWGVRRHGNHDNGLFFDGHVEPIDTPEKLWYASRDPANMP